MDAWSSRLNHVLACPAGSAWYSVDTRYSRIAVPAKRLAATTSAALPRSAAWCTRIGREATASRKPKPWLRALAISSPAVCSRTMGAIVDEAPRQPRDTGLNRFARGRIILVAIRLLLETRCKDDGASSWPPR